MKNNINPNPQIKVNFEDSTPVFSDKGNMVFVPGYFLRKISKFIAGTDEDSLIPVQIFYDVKTGMPLLESVPEFMRAEVEEFYRNSQ